MRIQLEHTQSLIKNANKYLDPLIAGSEARAPQNFQFLKSLKELDVSHANKLSETATSVKDLIKKNISKNRENVKKVAEKLHVQFDKATKIF